MSRKSVLGDDFHRKSVPKTSTIGFSTQKKVGKSDVKGSVSPYPIGSMYGIYANIGGILMVNVTIHSIHGSYGYVFHIQFFHLSWAREAREELFREVTKDGAKSVEARDPTNMPNFFRKLVKIFEDF